MCLIILIQLVNTGLHAVKIISYLFQVKIWVTITQTDGIIRYIDQDNTELCTYVTGIILSVVPLHIYCAGLFSMTMV